MPKKGNSLGPAFTEQVHKVTSKSGHFRNQKEEPWEDLLIPNYRDDLPSLSESSWKPVLATFIIITCFFVIFLRLFHLQVVKGSEMRQLADGNRVQIKIIHAPRGVIFDRNGKILAANSPGFRLIDPQSKKVKYISREEVEKGDLVYSEGTEGYLPRGLVLGQVNEVINNEHEVFKQAKVKELFDVRDFDLVFIISD